GRTVQYFQRARFEYHPDKGGTPYEVQLTLLGDQVTAGRRPFPTVDPFPSSDQQVYFPETGHSLSFGFLSYWRDRGGLDVFGYPISEEMTEDGYTVQYFQRARFEYHPELPEPYQVSLGLLGDQLLTQRLWLK
ncbi:MAG: glycosyl hydrolase, partial [Chloroflexota bacterium]